MALAPSPPLLQMQLFPDLPLELQQRVWEAASFIPRNVDVWTKNIYMSKGEACQAGHIHHRTISRTPVPAILHVCRESRQVALKHYKLSFGSTKDCGEFTITSKPRVYINPFVDTVCLPRPAVLMEFPATVQHGVPVIDDRPVHFSSALRDLRPDTLAINLFSPLGREGNVQMILGRSLMPSFIWTIKNMVFFWDAASYDHGRHFGDADPLLHTEATFEQIAEIELADSPHYMLYMAYQTLHALVIDTIQDYDRNEDYIARTIDAFNAMNISFCKLNGRWRSVGLR